MAAPKAPADRLATKSVTLEEGVFAVEVKPHLVHETVRAEQNEARSATRGGKSRGLVAGGRAKPWRQKGTGRARAGGTRAPHWTGGGMAFPPNDRNFVGKVNRKARKAALRSALSAHAQGGTLGVARLRCIRRAVDEGGARAGRLLGQGLPAADRRAARTRRR